MMNESRMCELAEMKEQLISCLKAAMAQGIDKLDTSEAGEVVDMIKDIAQCEKYCWEAEYYCAVVDAMEDDDEYDEPAGYSRPRRPNKVRYRKHPYHDQQAYIDGYLNDPAFRENMRMGYDHPRTDAERIADTMATIREIWKRADPELKTKMKNDINALVGEMK